MVKIILIFQFLILGYLLSGFSALGSFISAFQFLILGYKLAVGVFHDSPDVFQFLILGYEANNLCHTPTKSFQFLILGYLHKHYKALPPHLSIPHFRIHTA